MLPDPIKIMEAPYIKRDPDTGEVSWSPPQIELELIELGLINKPFTREEQNENSVRRIRRRIPQGD